MSCLICENNHQVKSETCRITFLPLSASSFGILWPQLLLGRLLTGNLIASFVRTNKRSFHQPRSLHCLIGAHFSPLNVQQ